MNERTNWGRWGSDDQRGTANLLTPERVLRACATPRSGHVYQLGIELRRSAPVGGDRVPPMHFMTHDGGDFAALDRRDWGTADDYVVMATQGTTHVDGLAHVWSDGKLYNGYPFTEVRSSGAAKLGLEHLGGLVAAAHLLDVTDMVGPSAGEVTPDVVESMLRARNGEVQAGDALLFRTGWMEAALTGETPDPDLYPVLSLSMGEWLADHDIAIVGADNIAIEAIGRRGVLPPLHKMLVRDLGMTLIELLHLADPAEAGVQQGMLIVAPLRISRGVGSPANPVLVV
jgi:kynurenine formamidase